MHNYDNEHLGKITSRSATDILISASLIHLSLDSLINFFFTLLTKTLGKNTRS